MPCGNRKTGGIRRGKMLNILILSSIGDMDLSPEIK
jgi:hypothetical protein